MKCLLWAALITSVSLVLASAGTLCAGVVMAETSTTNGPTGETSQNRTVYVQGNKQKVERSGVTTITDLDNSIIYIIDKKDRTYTEVPLQALSPWEPGGARGETIQLSKTGEKRVIADHFCNEYRANGGNKEERVTISACVSTSAPGAKELLEFERKMAARLGGRESERLNGHGSTILMLEKQSVVSFRVPDLSRHQAYRTASLLAETRVDEIQVKTLSAATFELPKGFSKLQKGPGSKVPPASPNVPEQTI
jgi:heat shock protein HslJ